MTWIYSTLAGLVLIAWIVVAVQLRFVWSDFSRHNRRATAKRPAMGTAVLCGVAVCIAGVEAIAISPLLSRSQQFFTVEKERDELKVILAESGIPRLRTELARAEEDRKQAIGKAALLEVQLTETVVRVTNLEKELSDVTRESRSKIQSLETQVAGYRKVFVDLGAESPTEASVVIVSLRSQSSEYKKVLAALDASSVDAAIVKIAKLQSRPEGTPEPHPIVVEFKVEDSSSVALAFFQVVKTELNSSAEVRLTPGNWKAYESRGNQLIWLGSFDVPRDVPQKGSLNLPLYLAKKFEIAERSIHISPAKIPEASLLPSPRD
jgi:hypothetical protein